MIFEFIALQICSANPQFDRNACTQTGKATNISVGLSQREIELQRHIDALGRYYFGEQLWNTTGTFGGLAYAGAKEKHLTYTFKQPKILNIEYVKPDVLYQPSKTQMTMTLSWNW